MPAWKESHLVNQLKQMRNIIDYIKEFIEENRNNAIATDCRWHTQRQWVYIRYNNIYSHGGTLQQPSITGNPESG